MQLGFESVRRRAAMYAAYAIVLVAALAAAYWHVAAPLDVKLLDAQQRYLREHHPRPAGTDVVVVGLDEAFLSSGGEPIALLHAHIARFLAAMSLARPAVVGMDVLLPGRSYRFLAPVDNPETNYD